MQMSHETNASNVVIHPNHFHHQNQNSYCNHRLFVPVVDQRIQSICPGFQGLSWRLGGEEWKSIFSVNNMLPFHYCEVGVLHGANLISVARAFCNHMASTIVAIDPFTDYPEYQEFRGEQASNYSTFLHNLNICALSQRVQHYRKFSHQALVELQDSYFHVIYLDSTNLARTILEDSILAWRKLAPSGILIINKYKNAGNDGTKHAVDVFVSFHMNQIVQHYELNNQYIVCKK